MPIWHAFLRLSAEPHAPGEIWLTATRTMPIPPRTKCFCRIRNYYARD